MTVAFWRATIVWARILPFIVAPVTSVTSVLQSSTPSKCAPAPMLTLPATCHQMFFACAPPASVTFMASAWVRSPVVWKIQVSLAPPEMVTSEGMVTLLVHL